MLETVQGGGGIVQAEAEYWQKLRKLCDQYGVIWVADEVQCGYGRTGRFYAFEHYGVIPDVTALAKSLGGGKAAVGAMIASRSVYMKAYGTPKTAMIHAQATFGGIGEACITAIEGLNVLYDEGLIDNAAVTGDYLIERLKAVQAKYPNIVKDVRGKGFMVGLEFHDFSQTLPMVLRPIVGMLDDKLKGSLSGFVGVAAAARLRRAGRLHRIQPQRHPAGAAADLPARACRPVRRRARRLAGPGHRVDRQGFREKPGRVMAGARRC